MVSLDEVEPQLQVEYLFCHVPKTGGTSLRKMFHKKFGKEACSNFNRFFDRLNKETRVVSAHIPISVARPLFPEAKIITLVRHPIIHMESLYNHFLRLPGSLPFITIPRGTKFTTFCKEAENYQSLFVDVPTEELWFAGLVDEMDCLRKILGMKSTLELNAHPHEYRLSWREQRMALRCTMEDHKLYSRLIK